MAHKNCTIEGVEPGSETDYRSLSGIEEALYGLAADYHLAFYIMLPLLDMDIDYSLYFEFWKGGGVYALTETEIVYSSIWDHD